MKRNNPAINLSYLVAHFFYSFGRRARVWFVISIVRSVFLTPSISLSWICLSLGPFLKFVNGPVSKLLDIRKKHECLFVGLGPDVNVRQWLHGD